ncbi:type II toxin-antitoxin system VapB family antitoxin [Gordonia insulae]|uniref:Antitoxin VapB2 n=1 Tax=Gordonia insulae TaxID=2420509 RepID=A0A3G8JQF3_9ACTN|nr:Antitoxin VapB2 [Gordonia insulae]
MSDILIRGVPDDVVAAIDARAARLGLSRTQYLRRRLALDAGAESTSVTVEDLQSFADTFSALADDHLMSQAWQ